MHRLCRTLHLCLLVVLATSSTLGAPAHRQQGIDFRADVSLVRLNVAVIDPDGGIVPPLGRDDFSVFDDGVPQEIALFLRPAEAPLEVALLLDSSTSVRPVSASVRSAALTFLSRLDPEDCVFVLPFSHRVGPGRWGDAGDPATRIFVDRVVAGGGTALYDALGAGLHDLEEGPGQVVGEELEDATEAEAGTADSGSDPPAGAGPDGPLPPPTGAALGRTLEAAILDTMREAPAPSMGGCTRPGLDAEDRRNVRKAIVVLSDGADENSTTGFSDVLQAARRSSVPVFPVALGYANQERRLKARLGELARATGGRLIGSVAPDRLRAAYDEVLVYLKSSYVLGYDPDATPEPAAEERVDPETGLRWHDVHVELRRPRFEVIVRPGYYR